MSDFQFYETGSAREMQHLPGLQDVSSDRQNGGPDELMNYDRVQNSALPHSRWTRRYTAHSANRKCPYLHPVESDVVLEVAPFNLQSRVVERQPFERTDFRQVSQEG